MGRAASRSEDLDFPLSFVEVVVEIDHAVVGGQLRLVLLGNRLQLIEVVTREADFDVLAARSPVLELPRHRVHTGQRFRDPSEIRQHIVAGTHVLRFPFVGGKEFDKELAEVRLNLLTGGTRLADHQLLRDIDLHRGHLGHRQGRRR